MIKKNNVNLKKKEIKMKEEIASRVPDVISKVTDIGNDIELLKKMIIELTARLESVMTETVLSPTVGEKIGGQTPLSRELAYRIESINECIKLVKDILQRLEI